MQGFELKALQGAKHLLEAGAINMIAFENEKPMLQAQGTNCEEVLSLMQSYNFTIFKWDGKILKNAKDCHEEPIGDLFAKYIHSTPSHH